MAREDNDLQEVTSYIPCDLDDDELSYDELEKSFDDLFNDSNKLGAKNASLKKLVTSLTLEKEDVEKAQNVLKDENKPLIKDLKTQKETFEKEKKALSSKLDDFIKLKGKALPSTKLLCYCVNIMRSPHDKTGLGYNSMRNNIPKAPKAMKDERSTSYHNSHKPKEIRYAPKKPSFTCHYCSKIGHHVSRSFVKRNSSK